MMIYYDKTWRLPQRASLPHSQPPPPPPRYHESLNPFACLHLLRVMTITKMQITWDNKDADKFGSTCCCVVNPPLAEFSFIYLFSVKLNQEKMDSEYIYVMSAKRCRAGYFTLPHLPANHPPTHPIEAYVCSNF